MKNIAGALLNAQKKIKNAMKDAKNPHFKNDYATLESVIDATKYAANESGIVIIQGTGADQYGHYVTTTLIHAESGEEMHSNTYLVLDKNNMQGLASAITYARKYGLAAMFCITQSDDDGNAASAVNPLLYRVDFGTKWVGKSLNEISPNDLKSTIEYFESSAKETGKPVSGKAKVFVDMATQYLSTL